MTRRAVLVGVALVLCLSVGVGILGAANLAELSIREMVLDPPSLAKREAERAGAIRAYGALVASAIKSLRKGGVLVAASCSAHVSAPEFFEAVRLAAERSDRGFTEIETTGHPPDHPSTFPEAAYLKSIYLKSL